jgi:hypothetical protein
MLDKLWDKDVVLLRRRLRARWGKASGAAVAYSALFTAISAATNPRIASLVVSGAALAAMLHPKLRAKVAAFVRQVAERRKVELALLDAMGERAPFVGAIDAVDIGEEVAVRVARGGDLAEIEKSQGKIAAALRAEGCECASIPRTPRSVSSRSYAATRSP